MYSIFFFYGGVGIVAVRLALAAIFIVHGWRKMSKPAATAKMFSSMGFRPGVFWGGIVTILEFFGGIALAVGFLVQPLAVLFAIQFIVIIIWKLAKGTPFVGEYGWELDLIVLAAVLVLLFNGAGPYSFDRSYFFGW